ncbi:MULTISPECIES: lysophospholipid transporter LplT [Oligella]|uniref:Major facilitator transporter n=1 Tax=Oligella urethralis DNF00040 TaxID=1401065 RepID=A0A095ZCI5_9BURK|nr:MULTISPECIES: lysophospholipid transporter LplT [Oligella]KGF32353.1 major facilitator transporter [Oligella urethralis DNF00040]MDK6203261.1 lysophospholipid transporter LplT [Oligella urethralis]OFV47834.1 MFS transporter [Oligella sp. HMSC09E12]PMC17927.1 lysophospholipid transporter LplT [Oligella urethralis]
MKRGFYTVMLAQTFSSLADNALFIVAIALIMELQGPEWLTPVMKWFFAFAYVILAAFVGAFADSIPKGRVMFITNSIKLIGCLMMFAFPLLGFSNLTNAYVVCLAYGIVGIGAATYSPAKYGIVTELLPPKDLVKGNSWIEGTTVISIIVGVMLGGFLTRDSVADALMSIKLIDFFAASPAEAGIVVVGFIYLLAALCNLMIPDTRFKYPRQERNPIRLIGVFSGYVRILWKDPVGQISLAVTTLFWGAGATLQLVVLKWGEEHLGYTLEGSAMLMGVAALGTVIGAVAASRVRLEQTLSVLPVGVLMGLSVLLMNFVQPGWQVIALLIWVGALSGYFVVPLNALLQHRGHVLLSAGHSIAVQNFNEQLNILLMVGAYAVMVHLNYSIYTIIYIFGALVVVMMGLVMLLAKHNQKVYPQVFSEIGSTAHGQQQHIIS